MGVALVDSSGVRVSGGRDSLLGLGQQLRANGALAYRPPLSLCSAALTRCVARELAAVRRALSPD